MLSQRISAHRRSAEDINKDPGCRYVKEHFTSGPCKGSSFSVNIIEKLQGNGRNADGKINEEITKYRRNREHWWISELRTSYPYGLNIRVGNKLCNEESDSFGTHENFPKFHPSKSLKEIFKEKKRGKVKPRSQRKAHAPHSHSFSKNKNKLLYKGWPPVVPLYSVHSAS